MSVFVMLLVLVSTSQMAFAEKHDDHAAHMTISASHMDAHAHHHHDHSQHGIAHDAFDQDSHMNMGHCGGKVMGSCCPLLTMPDIRFCVSKIQHMDYSQASQILPHSVNLNHPKRPPKS